MPQQQLNRNVRREGDPRARSRQYLLLVCGLILAAGFVAAARQQFAAVRYGYQSEELRRERERLLEEQRRLLLSLQETTSPAQLDRAARSIGLQSTRPAQLKMAAVRARDDESARVSSSFVGTASGAAGATLRR